MKKWLRLIVLGGVLYMCSACTSSDDLRRATWLWDATLLSDEQRVISFLTDQKFNTIFIQIDETVPQKTYATFIQAARAEHIDVYALGGAPTWGSDQTAPAAFFDWLTRYHQSHEESFTGIHVDVEPYLHPQWSEQQADVLLQFQRFLVDAQTHAATLGLPLEADLPFWFDSVTYDNEFGQGNVAQWAIELLDGVTLMAYRNEAAAIIAITEQEMAFAKDAQKEITIGVETMRSDEGDFVSFYGQSAVQIEAALRDVTSHYKNAPLKGIAVHHYSSIYKLNH